MEQEKQAPRPVKKAWYVIKEIASIAIISFVIVLPIRMFIAQPFVVSGDSMDNTFKDGSYLIIDEISYRFNEPQRGDVVIFKVPEEGLALQHQNLDKTVYYIKRVIGLPGETVEVNGDQIKIINSENPNGLILVEPYIYINKSVPSAFSQVKISKTLGDNEYFVLGDNRHNSSDSRIWGTLNKDLIKGRAIVRLFPFNQTGVFPGKFNFSL